MVPVENTQQDVAAAEQMEVLPAESPYGAAGGPPALPELSSQGARGRLGRLRNRKTGSWAAVALVCAAAGIAGSFYGAHQVASNDAAKARQAFPRNASAISSTLKQSVQHEEDIAIGGATFFAGNPQASEAEFDSWVKWSAVLRRYPELVKLGFLVLVRPPEVPAYEAHVSGRALKPRGTLTPTQAAAAFHPVPAGSRPYYCLVSTELVRGPLGHARSGLDYCSLTPGLLATRDTAASVYARAAAGARPAWASRRPSTAGTCRPPGSTPAAAPFSDGCARCSCPPR